MGFFNPGLLWFALGGAIPVIIHLLNRQKHLRVRWAAMEFLLAAFRKTRRRLRIENLILLLVRVLLMVFLAAAIARPFFRETPLGILGDTEAHHIFVIDTSYSMGYKQGLRTVLDGAKAAATALLDETRASEADRFSLLTLSAYPEVILRERPGKELIRSAIQELKPSHYGTRVAAAMTEVRNVLDSTRHRDRRVYLFTDLQRTGWEFRDEAEAGRFADLLKGLSARPDTKFIIHDVGVRDALNHAVVDLRTDDRVATTKRTARFHAAVHNYSAVPLREIGVSLHVDGSLVETRPAVLPPNDTTPVAFEYRFTEAGPHIVRVSVEGDYLDVDDQRHLALDVRNALRGLVVDGEPGNSVKESETYAFLLALDPTREGLYFSADVRTPELFNAEGLEAYDFLVLANVQSLPAEKVEKIEQFVRRGGGLLITLGPRVDAVSFNNDFWNGGRGLSPARLEEIAGTAPEGALERGIERRIGRFAAEHPVFRTFREKLRAAIYDLVFYKYYTVKEFAPDRVLASFDDDPRSPAVIEKVFGEGRTLLFTSTIDHEWNAGIQGHPPYLPLVWNICEHLSMRNGGKVNLFVGDLLQLDLPAEKYQPPFLLETPMEGTVTLPASAPEKDQKFFRLFYPARSKADDPKVLINEGLRHAGAYVLTRQAAREEDRRAAYFAVNVPPREPSAEEIHAAEGNLDRIPPEEIQRRFPDFKAEFRGVEKRPGGEASAGPPPPGGVWKHLLYLLMGFMVLESILAWLFGRAK